MHTSNVLVCYQLYLGFLVITLCCLLSSSLMDLESAELYWTPQRRETTVSRGGGVIVLLSYQLKPEWMCVDAEVPQDPIMPSPFKCAASRVMDITAEAVSSTAQVICRLFS